MNHPYQDYIETKAADYYGRQAHEPHCETLQPYRVPRNERTGETYDVYIIQHCDCWLSVNFDKLTLERKLKAMRALSHGYGLHSPACSLLRRTPIIYRGRPEIMTGWCDCWLSIDIRPDPEKSCPVCSKPLFYAPYAPEDTAKQACSDLNCVNAHGIIHHDPLDKWDKLAVEYRNQPEEQRKDHTMNVKTDLIIAKSRADEFRNAQNSINSFLAPFVKDYAEFLTEENARGFDHRDFKADTFVEIEGSTFYLTGESIYEYGEDYTPSLSLPFAFVEDPQQFKDEYRKQQAEIKAKADAKKKADKQDMVDRLKAQLARAEAELAKAEEQSDPIKTVANRNKAKELREQFMEQG